MAPCRPFSALRFPRDPPGSRPSVSLCSASVCPCPSRCPCVHPLVVVSSAMSPGPFLSFQTPPPHFPSCLPISCHLGFPFSVCFCLLFTSLPPSLLVPRLPRPVSASPLLIPSPVSTCRALLVPHDPVSAAPRSSPSPRSPQDCPPPPRTGQQGKTWRKDVRVSMSCDPRK